MALHTCTKCGTRFSDIVTFCPDCRTPRVPEESAPDEVTPTAKSASKNPDGNINGFVALGAVALFTVVIVAVVTAMSGGGGGGGGSSDSGSVQADDAGAQLVCREFRALASDASLLTLSEQRERAQSVWDDAEHSNTPQVADASRRMLEAYTSSDTAALRTAVFDLDAACDLVPPL